MGFLLKQHFNIESARFLPKLPKDHPCSNIHGHSFKIILAIQGPLSEVGWVIDYNDIAKTVSPILKQLDHKLLNEIPGLENPTSELIAQHLFRQIKLALPGLESVTIAETPLTEVIYKE